MEYVDTFPEEAYAGASYGPARTLFESIRDEQVLRGIEILGPFESDAEWQLAKWLIKNVGHNQAEEFLKLPIVCDNRVVWFKLRTLTFLLFRDPRLRGSIVCK